MKTVRVLRILASIALWSSLSSAARAALPFVEDDYGKALRQARGRGAPLFVEAWAPW